MNNFTKKIEFIDKDKHRAIIDLEITHRNGYPEFSASGDYCGSGGQCLDSVNPRTAAQKQLIEMWKEWHLNGLNAGTPEQTAAIKEWEKQGNEYSYDAACEHLKSINLYNVEYNGAPYSYGSSWLVRELPKDFEKILFEVIATIEKEEQEYQKEKPEKTGDDIILEQMEEYGISDDQLDAVKAYIAAGISDDLKDFEESFSGQFYNDEEFAQDMAENIGAINKNAQWPNNCIDWEHAARELMYDYTEQDGYYFRNI